MERKSFLKEQLSNLAWGGLAALASFLLLHWVCNLGLAAFSPK